LFGKHHVPDIVGTSGSAPAAGLMSRKEIVAALIDTCVMLDERKAQFELMIHALEKEDAEAESEHAGSGEEKDDDANDDREEASDSSSDAA